MPTSAPSAANCSAIARPIPLLDAATNAARPRSPRSMGSDPSSFACTVSMTSVHCPLGWHSGGPYCVRWQANREGNGRCRCFRLESAFSKSLPMSALVLDALAPVIGNGMITLSDHGCEGVLVVRDGRVAERVWVANGARTHGDGALALIRSADTAMVSARRLSDEAMGLLGPLLRGSSVLHGSAPGVGGLASVSQRAVRARWRIRCRRDVRPRVEASRTSGTESRLPRLPSRTHRWEMRACSTTSPQEVLAPFVFSSRMLQRSSEEQRAHLSLPLQWPGPRSRRCPRQWRRMSIGPHTSSRLDLPRRYRRRAGVARGIRQYLRSARSRPLARHGRNHHARTIALGTACCRRSERDLLCNVRPPAERPR